MNADEQPQQARINSAHSILWYIEKHTSNKHPEWRDDVISFLYKLFNIANNNYGIDIRINPIEGIHINYDDKFIYFFHVRQKHLLLHLNKNSMILDHPMLLNWKPHTRKRIKSEIKQPTGWIKMFKITKGEELDDIVDYLNQLPRITPKDYYKSRTIPAKVKTMVWDRDKGHCVKCGSIENLCFDHIIPFSKGGTSKDPKNIQILCEKCNLNKGNHKFV